MLPKHCRRRASINDGVVYAVAAGNGYGRDDARAGAAARYLESAPSATADRVDEALSSNATVGKITWNNPVGWKPARGR